MPLFSCDSCKDRECVRLLKPCEKVEKILRGEGIKRADYIRPRVSPKRCKKEQRDGLDLSPYREIPFENNKLEELAALRAFRLRYGKSAREEVED